MNLRLIVVSFVLGMLSCSKNNPDFEIESFLDHQLEAGISPTRVFGYQDVVVFPYSEQLVLNNAVEEEVKEVSGRKELNLLPSVPNIKDYIVDDQLILRVEIFFNRTPPRTFELAYNLRFGVLLEE